MNAREPKIIPEVCDGGIRTHVSRYYNSLAVLNLINVYSKLANLSGDK